MRLIDATKIWDEAAHNAFTDLIRFDNQWLCTFREGETHLSGDGALRLIASSDGKHWTSRALITSPSGDLRDPKLSITPDGRLMLIAAECRQEDSEFVFRSLVWFSGNGISWGEPQFVGDTHFWLWRATWHKGAVYAAGYDCREENRIRFYSSKDGRTFAPIAGLYDATGFPNESSMVFDGDIAYCLLRRDGEPNTALWGKASPPYMDWEWKDMGVRVGGPHMLFLPDGALIAAVRLHDWRIRTSLCSIDLATATLDEILELPSGGDTSYPGLAFHDGELWVSYYSSHEGKTAIYLARVAVDNA